MDKMDFVIRGCSGITLEWLEPADYYAGPWTYYGDARGTDGEYYSIVLSLDATEMRYTIV